MVDPDSKIHPRRRGSRALSPRLKAFLSIMAHNFRITMRMIQPFIVLTALGLIGMIVFAYFMRVFPIIWSSGSIGRLISVLMTVPGLYLLYGILLNYSMAVCTAPGFASTSEPQVPLPSFCDSHGRDQNEVKVYCVSCKIIKPPRSHHCSFCNQCVLVRSYTIQIHLN